MILYKNEEIFYNKIGDYPYMIIKVNEDYRNYYKASEYLQKRYDFSLQAIYSCLSKVNNGTKKGAAYKELSKLLGNIKKISGLNMKIINDEDNLSVREKPKMKIKRRVF